MYTQSFHFLMWTEIEKPLVSCVETCGVGRNVQAVACGLQGRQESKGARRQVDLQPPFSSQPHLPDDKSQDAVGLEQQHLLTTAPSSSSSSLESSASAGDRRAPPGGHPQARVTAEAQGSQEACAGSRSSGERQEPAVFCVDSCPSIY